MLLLIECKLSYIHRLVEQILHQSICLYFLSLNICRPNSTPLPFPFVGILPWWVSTTCAARGVCACRCWEPAWVAPRIPARASSLWHFWPFPTLLLLRWSLSHPSGPNDREHGESKINQTFLIRDSSRYFIQLEIYLHPFDSPNSSSSIVGGIYSRPFLLRGFKVFVILWVAGSRFYDDNYKCIYTPIPLCLSALQIRPNLFPLARLSDERKLQSPVAKLVMFQLFNTPCLSHNLPGRQTEEAIMKAEICLWGQGCHGSLLLE